MAVMGTISDRLPIWLLLAYWSSLAVAVLNRTLVHDDTDQRDRSAPCLDNEIEPSEEVAHTTSYSLQDSPSQDHPEVPPQRQCKSNKRKVGHAKTPRTRRMKTPGFPPWRKVPVGIQGRLPGLLFSAYPYGRKPEWPGYYTASRRLSRPSWKVIDTEITKALLRRKTQASGAKGKTNRQICR
jgi:hypothetical protein